MASYERKKAGDRLLETFPGLTQEDLDKVDSYFTPYLSYVREKKSIQIWCTSCHREIFLDNHPRMETPTERESRAVRHGDIADCPMCGQKSHVISPGKFRTGFSVEEYIPFLILDVSPDGQTVWAQGYWTRRWPHVERSGVTTYKPTSVYMFQPGSWRQWDIWGDNPVEATRKWAQEPFQEGGMCAGYSDYYVIGIEKLQRSFLRYTGYETPVPPSEAWEWKENHVRHDLIRYLAMASVHPAQVEMLRKAGLHEFLYNWVYQRRKNADVLKWSESDPRTAFALTKQELKDYINTIREGGKRASDWSNDILRLYRKTDGTLDMATTYRLLQVCGHYSVERASELLRNAETFGVSHRKLIRYLERGGGLGRNCQLWLDYIRMAKDIGLDLTNPLIQMPGDLEHKHDETEKIVATIQDQRAAEAAKARYRELTEKYGFEMDGLCIQVPTDVQDIKAEGKALRHCVASYAQRHAEGELAILFLRKADHLETPYVTIEMHGEQMVQINGYQNDKNRESPWVTHREFINTWLAWVKAGSKRYKDGQPKLPRPRKKGNAA